jgi:hypothetical protein
MWRQAHADAAAAHLVWSIMRSNRRQIALPQQTIGALLRRLRLRRNYRSRFSQAESLCTGHSAEQGHSANLTMLFKAALAMDLEIDRIFLRVRDRRSRRPVNGTGFSK